MTAAAALPNVVDAVICFGKEAMQPWARPGSGGRPSVATSGLCPSKSRAEWYPDVQSTRMVVDAT